MENVVKILCTLGDYDNKITVLHYYACMIEVMIWYYDYILQYHGALNYNANTVNCYNGINIQSHSVVLGNPS